MPVVGYRRNIIHLYDNGEHAGAAIGGRMLRVQRANGISYYICGRREIIRAREGAGGCRAAEGNVELDSLLERNMYYRFWDETGGYPGSNHDKCIDIHRRAQSCIRRLKVPLVSDRTPAEKKLFPIPSRFFPASSFLSRALPATVNLFDRSKTGSPTWRSCRNPCRRGR